MERRELAVDRVLVPADAPALAPAEGRSAAGRRVEDGGRREPRRDEALVHPVARDRIDQPGGVADEERALTCDSNAGAAQRQTMPAQRGKLRGLEPVCLAEAPEVRAEIGACLLPAADADVRMLGLREDPAVPARDVGQLDHR